LKVTKKSSKNRSEINAKKGWEKNIEIFSFEMVLGRVLGGVWKGLEGKKICQKNGSKNEGPGPRY